MTKQPIPKGYKLTEMGVIPEDWEVKRLGDIGNPIIGLTYNPRNISDSGILVLRSSNIKDNTLVFTDNVYVKMELPKRVLVQKGDILICVRNGSRQLIGKCALITEKVKGLAFGAFMSVFRSTYNNFIFYQFQSDNLQTQICEIMGATINQITNKDLSDFKVPLPKNIKEQTAIANALSDTDTLISQLKKLIAKKQAIKTATMQQLLTGKTRLPEFACRADGSLKGTKASELGTIPEDWEIETLGSILNYEQPTQYLVADKNYLPIGSLPVLTAGKTFILGYTEEKNNIFINYPVIIFDDFTTEIKYVNFSFKVKSSALKFLKSKTDDMPLYLMYHLMNMIYFQVGDHKRHWIGEYKNIKVAFPRDIFERKALSIILTNMDQELTTLEQRLAKTEQIKQGMMQQLLTGKIRLI